MVRAICTTVYLGLQLVKGIEDDVADSSLLHFRSKDDEDSALDEAVEVASCPHGWLQVGAIGADIGGCGMTSCGARYGASADSAGSCALKCGQTAGCKSFNWAPLNGDRNHGGKRVCTMYSSDKATGTWTGTNGQKQQVLCKPAGTIPLSGSNDANAKNLQRCTGECDADSQCASGLVCFQRQNGEAIPGCSGPGHAKDWDYCYDPYGILELSGGNDGNARNLQRCTGECDADTQCASGLKCFQRQNGEAIPGCSGPGHAKDWDYCYRPDGTIPLSGDNNPSAKNLQRCTGECDDDAQCAEGLICFQRQNGEAIPGCSGLGGGKDWDYCYDPYGNVELSGGNDGSAKNLQRCTGECDADSQCSMGLQCFQRQNGEAIPGCSGPGHAKDWDYCYRPDGTIPLSGSNDANAKNLKRCTGECDADSQCASGLKCFQRQNGETIPGCSGPGGNIDWDYCYDPNADIPLSGGNDGSAKNLQRCTGECDADTQCAAGLTCFQRQNGEAIPGCSGSGHAKDWDYCYDPSMDPGVCKGFEWAPVNGNIGDCGAMLLSGDSCKPGCNAGYTLKGATSCKDGKVTAATCQEMACEIIAAPSNGNKGDCGSTLDSGATCKPACNAGYTLEGLTSCSKGALSAATCEEKSCTGLAAPVNGAMGNCPTTLKGGDSCSPSCNLFFEAKKSTSCSKGALTAATCTTIFDCNAGLKYWNIGWSDAKKDHCCKKEEFCKEPCSLVSNKKVTGKETGSCFKMVKGLSESDCKFHCRQAKYVVLCEVWMYQKSGSVCKHWGQCADQKLGATASGFTSGVCEVPPLPCSITAPSNGNEGDCGKTLASGDSCKPGCNAGYTLSGTSICTDGKLKAATCKESPCKVVAPENGGMGECGKTIPSGSSCKPKCNPGYTVVGQSSCSLGSITAAKCKESDCKVTAPQDGGLGNCEFVLKSGDTCSPSCNLYYTLSGETSCLKGKLTVATCPTIFDCNAGILNWKIGWSSAKQTACCGKNGIICK